MGSKIIQIGQVKALFSNGVPVVYFDGHIYYVTASPNTTQAEMHVGAFLTEEAKDMLYTGKNIQYVSPEFLANIS